MAVRFTAASQTPCSSRSSASTPSGKPRMDSISLIRRLHQHRTWVNEQLLVAANRLSAEQLERPLAIGQGSIWRSLVHLYAAEYVWLEALQGNEEPLLPGDEPGKLPGNQLGSGGLEGLDQLQQHWRKLEDRWSSYLASLRPEMLDELIYKRSTSSGAGQRRGTRRADVLLHVATHAQYTTAQIINMLRQLGATSLPDVMLISLARQRG